MGINDRALFLFAENREHYNLIAAEYTRSKASMHRHKNNKWYKEKQKNDPPIEELIRQWLPAEYRDENVNKNDNESKEDDNNNNDNNDNEMKMDDKKEEDVNLNNGVVNDEPPSQKNGQMSSAQNDAKSDQ